MRKMVLITGIAALMLASCAKDDIPSKGEDFSQDPVSVLLNQYCAKRKTGTRNILAGVDVRNIERHYYTISGDGVSEISSDTRSAGDETTTFEIARADFELDGRNGYAYICTHPKAEGVYLYTDNGVITDTVENKGLAGMIGAVPYAAGGIIDAGGTQFPDTVSQLNPNLNITIGPLLRTKWGQRKPYNDCAPRCICSECDGNDNCAIGCATTATAQTIAYCKRFSGTFYGNKNLPFAKMTSKPFASQLDSATRIRIAPFFHEVALCCQIQFKHSSSSTLKSAYQYLVDLGYTCTFKDKIEAMRLFENITKYKIPQIIGGTGKSGGHAWVIDGWRQIDGKVEYYNNWGWNGSSDCWIDSSLLGTSETGYDFSESLQMIGITRY